MKIPPLPTDVGEQWRVVHADRSAVTGALEARRLGAPGYPRRATTLMFSDPDSGELLRTRPNPLTGDEIHALQDARLPGRRPVAGPNRSPFSAASAPRV
jgi:hypothetical protein